MNAEVYLAEKDLSRITAGQSGADVYVVDGEMILKAFLKSYTEAMKEISGTIVDADDIERHMAADNVITTFTFWHEFLHGNEEARVRGIYDKMTADFHIWEM